MIERDDKYEEKYYLFKVEDMDNMLKTIHIPNNSKPSETFRRICLAYDEYRRIYLGKEPQRYIAFNEDEPYAQFLYDFIVGNKDWKQFLPEEWNKLERRLRIAQNARDEQYFKAKKQEDELAAMSEDLQDQGECCRRMEDTMNQLLKENTELQEQVTKFQEINKNAHDLELKLYEEIDQLKRMNENQKIELVKGIMIRNVTLGEGEAIYKDMQLKEIIELRREVKHLREFCGKVPAHDSPIAPTCGPITRAGCTEKSTLGGKIELDKVPMIEYCRVRDLLKSKEIEVTQLRNDLQLCWKKCEDLQTRNDTLESIRRTGTVSTEGQSKRIHFLEGQVDGLMAALRMTSPLKTSSIGVKPPKYDTPMCTTEEHSNSTESSDKCLTPTSKI